MTEQEQLLETIQKILKPIEPSNNPPKGISPAEMSRKVKSFQQDLKIKEQKVKEIISGYIDTRHPSDENKTFIIEEAKEMFNQYIKSFNK